MSELKRNITTIAEQDEHQVLNQPSTTASTASASSVSEATATCESIYSPQSNCTLLGEANSANHNNLSTQASHSPLQSCNKGTKTTAIDGCNIKRQFDSISSTTLFKESSSNSIQLAKEVTRGKKKLFRIKESQSSSSSSIEYKRIDERDDSEDLETFNTKTFTSKNKSSSIALLVTMILIYYSLLFILLFKFHSTLAVPDEDALIIANDTVDRVTDSSVKHESTSTAPIDPMSMSIGIHSMAAMNHRSGDTGSGSFSSSSSSSSLASSILAAASSSSSSSSTDDSFGVDSLFDKLQEDKHLKKNSIQLGLARDSSDDGQGDSVVQITDSLSLDDHLPLGQVNSHFFDISLDEPNDQLHLSWIPEYKRRQLLLQVQFHQRTKFDWFAIGFSDYGNITKADLCILWPDHKGQFHFEV